jgi:hypothetical protein
MNISEKMEADTANTTQNNISAEQPNLVTYKSRRSRFVQKNERI